MRQRKSASVFYFLAPEGQGSVSGSWRPNADIYETDTHVVVALEVPGVKPEELEVTEHAHGLVVKGVRRPTTKDDPKHFHQIEIVCGEFEKQVVLPEALKGAPVEATLSLGILYLRIQKDVSDERRNVRKIRIEGQ